ncbi:putative permease [Suhomyces tanzawaensis NRRL Y-17324]|uniref:Putative permease n=1 Tax=Suhomyces tanzawaensis NRRL Y-17324 TaxID=984487 RepID=A0A1E4SMX0_9ASCO|nr:putative permease [Suhomyces tanzawaensis NRRL Y-17324]ODV80732.1 putative permease [Suhomyces tanzawaensis NRRL Y-17324]
MSSIENDKKLHIVVSDSHIDLESSNDLSENHIFKDPEVAEYYRQLYDKTQYECRDWFDPDFTYTKQEERKVVRKNDWYVTFWALIMFIALDFDRGNLQQALADNFLKDLHLTTNQLNIGNTINLVCFLFAELPSQLISKKIGADVWIPMQMVLWSVVTMSQGALKDVHGFYATRAFLGALQGGFICDVCLWMSYFYTTSEMPVRLAYFYIANPLSTVLSSLLAFALLRIRTPAVTEGWKWLFIIEGAFTLLIGVAAFFKMPASAVQTRTWFRKKGWYTDREEKIVVNRILRDDPTKGDMHNREPVGPKELLKTLLDYDLLPIYIIRILSDLSANPVGKYMQILLRTMGFTTFETNALTIPNNIIAIFTMLAMSYISVFFKSNALVMASVPLWIVACLIPLRYWPGAQVEKWGTYAALTVLLSHPPTWAISISWCSANSNSVRTRAVSAAVVNIFSQAAGIIGSNIYRQDDAPLYHRGNTQLIGIAFGAIGTCLLARFYYIFRNKQKEKAWNKLSEEEQRAYSLTTTDEGNKRLDFKFAY